MARRGAKAVHSSINLAILSMASCYTSSAFCFCWRIRRQRTLSDCAAHAPHICHTQNINSAANMYLLVNFITQRFHQPCAAHRCRCRTLGTRRHLTRMTFQSTRWCNTTVSWATSRRASPKPSASSTTAPHSGSDRISSAYVSVFQFTHACSRCACCVSASTTAKSGRKRARHIATEPLPVIVRRQSRTRDTRHTLPCLRCDIRSVRRT